MTGLSEVMKQIRFLLICFLALASTALSASCAAVPPPSLADTPYKAAQVEELPVLSSRLPLPDLPDPVGLVSTKSGQESYGSGGMEYYPGALTDLPALPDPRLPSRSSLPSDIYLPVSGTLEVIEEDGSRETPEILEVPEPDESFASPPARELPEPREDAGSTGPVGGTPGEEFVVEPSRTEETSPTETVSPPAVPVEPEAAELRAAPGEDLAISLAGDGWYYTGATVTGEEPAGSQPRFLQRILRDGTTIFLFAVEQQGRWQLEFRRQDAVEGSVDRRLYLLHALPMEGFGSGDSNDFPAASAREPDGLKAAETGPGPSDSGTDVGLLYQGGELQGALSEAMQRFESGKAPTGIEVLFSLKPPDPRKHPGAIPETLLDGTWVDSLDRLEGRIDGTTEAALVAFLQWLIPALPEGNLDLYYYRLARLLESPPSPRDERRAVEYYKLIRDRYPWSPYWELAGERERYLRRHYLELR